MTSPIAIDFETFYDDECSVKTLGPEAYARRPKFVPYWVSMYGNDLRYSGPPADAPWRELTGLTLLSHNAGFEWTCFKWLMAKGGRLDKGPAIRAEQLEDTTGLCTYLGAPRYLAGAVKQLLPDEPEVDKSVRGSMKGKLPKDLNAVELAALSEYALNDARLCWLLWDTYSSQWPEHERRLARLAWLRGSQGVHVNIPALDAGIDTLQETLVTVEATLPWVAKGRKPSSPLGLKESCLEAGIPPPITTAEDDPRAQAWERIYSEKVPWVSTMRRWRKANLLLKRLSTTKLRVNPLTSRMGYSLKYYGAHTGRWSGDTGWNIQGLHRDPVEGVSMRALITAPPGKKLITADLAQIEPRCLAWLCGDQRLLDLLRAGHGMYQAHAEESMGWKGGNLKKEDNSKYRLSKARVLGLGYGCGPERFVEAAWTMAEYRLTLKEAKIQVADFREKNPRIIHLWNTLETAFRSAARERRPVFEVELPSGRSLRYFNPKLKAGQLCAQVERGGLEKFFWGGKLCENLTQATARDVLAHIILTLEDAGFPVLFHVHDDETNEVDLSVSIDTIRELMIKPPPWLEGCPLEVEIKAGPSYE